MRVVVNRMRPTLGWSERDIAGMVEGFARLVDVHFLPEDRAAADRALVTGTAISAAGDSDLGRAVAAVAAALVPSPSPHREHRARIFRPRPGRARRKAHDENSR